MTWLEQILPLMHLETAAFKRFDSGARWKGLQLKPIEQVEFDDLWLITGVGRLTMLAFCEACRGLGWAMHPTIVRWYSRETATREECPLCHRKIQVG